VARVLCCWAAAALFSVGCVRKADLPRIAQVPAFVLRDQNDRELSRGDLRGSVWIANFMFTSCPDVCPLLTAKMSGVRSRLVGDRAKVRFVSFSVDPAHDTPAALKKYAIEHRADWSDWTFLTGPADLVQQVIVSGFKQTLRPDPESTGKVRSILHGSHFVLIDRGLFIRAYYPSDEEGLLRLARDARIVLAEKSGPAGGPS
jgi:protein SCO1/2